ncbi:MAG: hypothetical protein CMA99_01015 [Euryarchaeota archaeon]|nr:hypothetical protein [Euryarchaeota archaeon]
MEIVSRTENKLLNRVEIDFKWNHKSSKTPSKKEVMDLVKTLEPGSNPDFIVVKNCKTRYGQALTTGQALIYETAAAMKVEPEYIHERHKGFRSGNASEEAPEETPEEAAEEPAEEPKEGDE